MEISELRTTTERRADIDKKIKDHSGWIAADGPHSANGKLYRRTLAELKQAQLRTEPNPGVIGLDDTIALLRSVSGEKMPVEIKKEQVERFISGDEPMSVVSTLLNRLGKTPKEFVRDLSTLHKAIEPGTGESFLITERMQSEVVVQSKGKPINLIQTGYRLVLYDPSNMCLYPENIKDIRNKDIQLGPVDYFAYDKKRTSPSHVMSMPLPEGYQPVDFRIRKGTLDDDDRQYLAAIAMTYGNMTPEAKRFLYTVN